MHGTTCLACASIVSTIPGGKGATRAETDGEVSLCGVATAPACTDDSSSTPPTASEAGASNGMRLQEVLEKLDTLEVWLSPLLLMLGPIRVQQLSGVDQSECSS